MNKYKLFLYFAGFFIFYVILPRISYASEFAFDYDVNYEVLESGTTKVVNRITLTNLLSGYYAQNYQLTINSERISQVSALDSNGKLYPQVTIQNGQTSIIVPFTTKTVGINKMYTFTLAYASRDIAAKKGRIWEIIIPGPEKRADLRTYRVYLSVPKSFGEAAYLSPPPSRDGYWHLDTLEKKGISAAFGEVQSFGFNLIYHLENTSDNVEFQEITLPADNAFQQVVLQRLSEKPENVEIDNDGNWLARYKLEKNEVKKIIAEGNILVYTSPRKGFNQKLTSLERKVYTSEQKYWEANEEMKLKAKELKSAQAIYDFVVDTLSYDYSRVRTGVERLGATYAFAQPKLAVCMEFSDLFVALSRAAGIPAREIHGYAYTNNSRLQPLSLVTDVLHAWAEYYDEERELWIPVDPTWGNTTLGVDYFTKLDFNHIAFAILGVKSDYPYPAGSFRRDLSGKDVFVEFTDDLPQIPKVAIEATVELPSFIISGTKYKGNISISNPGPVVASLDAIETRGKYAISLEEGETVIPPNGQRQVSFLLAVPLSWLPYTSEVEFIVKGNRVVSTVRVLPFFLTIPYLGGMGLLAGGGVYLYAKRRKSHH